VDLFVAGSSVFDTPDYGQAIQGMAALARTARNVS
jgi:pentose-5-phosphate-3-epimerase